MKRITIHLLRVERTKGRIFNTLAFKVKSNEEGQKIVARYGENVKKHYFSNIN